METIDNFIRTSFSELIQKYHLIIETFEGDLYSHIYNQYVHFFARTEMYNRTKYALTVKVIKHNANYFFTTIMLYHYAGLDVPKDYNYKNGFCNNVNLLDMHFSWLLNGEYAMLDQLIIYDLKHDFLVREHSDWRYYDNKFIHDIHEVAWVSEMECLVRKKYDLMLNSYYQEAIKINVPTYFPLNDFEMVKPILIESLFMIEWDYTVYWGNTDYSWVKRLAEKAGF